MPSEAGEEKQAPGSCGDRERDTKRRAEGEKESRVPDAEVTFGAMQAIRSLRAQVSRKYTDSGMQVIH